MSISESVSGKVLVETSNIGMVTEEVLPIGCIQNSSHNGAEEICEAIIEDRKGENTQSQESEILHSNASKATVPHCTTKGTESCLDLSFTPHGIILLPVFVIDIF